MLVLSRKIGETIVINGRITVTVQRMSGNRVSLAIEAPREVHIARGELAPLEPAVAEAPQRTFPAEARIPSDEGFQSAMRDKAAQGKRKARAKPMPR